MAGQPRDQAGAAGSLDQPGQAADLGTHPQQRPDLLVVVQPSAAGDAVRAEVPAADLLVLHAQRAARGGSGPLADLGQVLADLAGGRATDRDTERLPVLADGKPREQRAGVPLLPDRRADVSRAGPPARPVSQWAQPGRAAGTSAPGRGDEVADLDLLSDLVRGPPGLVLVDGERLQPRIVAVRVVDEAHRGHVRLDDVDLLQRGDDEQLQAEPAEQLQREPGRLVGAPAERLIDDREPERPGLRRTPFQLELVGERGAKIVQASFSFCPPDLPPESA
jgi:hypothetical protein